MDDINAAARRGMSPRAGDNESWPVLPRSTRIFLGDDTPDMARKEAEERERRAAVARATLEAKKVQRNTLPDLDAKVAAREQAEEKAWSESAKMAQEKKQRLSELENLNHEMQKRDEDDPHDPLGLVPGEGKVLMQRNASF